MAECQIVTKVISGTNALAETLRAYRHEQILIICDTFLNENGTIQMVTKEIDPSNTVAIFDDIVPDPTLDVIAHGVKEIVSLQPTVVIGFGGGAAMDSTKGILYFAINGKILYKRPVFIAVPTTSGTGSEMTAFAILTDAETKRKLPIEDDLLYADVAVLDPHLILSVPPTVTANTGFDVITHAIEAYVSTGASAFTDGVACKSFELAVQALLVCYHHGDDLEARNNMLSASNMAGIAFNLSGLGMVHSLAHQLGGVFHVPHGLACAMLLPSCIRYNCCLSKVREKYADLAYKVGIAPRTFSKQQAVTALCAILLAMMDDMDMPKRVSELPHVIERDVYEKEISRMAQNTLQDRLLPGNPVLVTYEDAVHLFHEIY